MSTLLSKIIMRFIFESPFWWIIFFFVVATSIYIWEQEKKKKTLPKLFIVLEFFLLTWFDKWGNDISSCSHCKVMDICILKKQNAQKKNCEKKRTQIKKNKQREREREREGFLLFFFTSHSRRWQLFALEIAATDFQAWLECAVQPEHNSLRCPCSLVPFFFFQNEKSMKKKKAHCNQQQTTL